MQSPSDCLQKDRDTLVNGSNISAAYESFSV